MYQTYKNLAIIRFKVLLNLTSKLYMFYVLPIKRYFGINILIKTHLKIIHRCCIAILINKHKLKCNLRLLKINLYIIYYIIIYKLLTLFYTEEQNVKYLGMSAKKKYLTRCKILLVSIQAVENFALTHLHRTFI